MDKEIESFWQGARGYWQLQLAEGSRGSPGTIRERLQSRLHLGGQAHLPTAAHHDRGSLGMPLQLVLTGH